MTRAGAPLATTDAMPWPRGEEPLPPCEPGATPFALPPLERGGDIRLEFSAPLQPAGVVERARVTVLTAHGERDLGCNGYLKVPPPSGVDVLEVAPVAAGESEVTFRFQDLGTVRVEVALDGDDRTGYSEVSVYQTQLPIWEMHIDEADLSRVVDDASGTETADARLVIDGIGHPASVRLHGGSSRYYPKKSFRFDLTDVPADTWGKHLILRAEYNDKSMLRNWLALALFRTGTWVPAPRAQLVHFRINDRYYGVMDNVERIDAAFLKRLGLDGDGSLYEADPPLELGVPGGNLTVLASDADYRAVYQHHLGSIDYQDLETLITNTLTLPDTEFDQRIENEVVVSDYLVYLAMQAAIQDHDQVRKNFYMYRDLRPGANSRWRFLPWDLDLTLGHLWTEANDTLDESIFTDEDVFFGARLAARGALYNQLTDRVFKRPAYRQRFRELLARIAKVSLARAQLEPLLSNAVCRATPDLLADSNKRASNDEYLDRVAEILDFVEARAAYVLAE